jgi:hypothetical protein
LAVHGGGPAGLRIRALALARIEDTLSVLDEDTVLARKTVKRLEGGSRRCTRTQEMESGRRVPV